ncbi:Oxysterol-binding protein-related protein 3 [Camelus dromedarius]|uniref:Oxysterol-binding protein-related protein 3 n=1 Tax=Camelus dromedarius TaxID=9838 RepID=A0A5N4DZ12_CAMDR|nr:Oxysterol-binding protein-related protein 3 [Camelus dromedarius]
MHVTAENPHPYSVLLLITLATRLVGVQKILTEEETIDKKQQLQVSVIEINFELNCFVGTGQLGSGGRTEGRDELHPGATSPERIFAEKEEMALERLAQEILLSGQRNLKICQEPNRLASLVLPLQIEREKLHGCIDVGLSVMSVKKSSKCIDLDTEEHIYHLKVKSEDVFDEWVSKLRHHRLYRQNEIAMFPHDVNHFLPGATVTDSPPGVLDSISSRKVKIRGGAGVAVYQSRIHFKLEAIYHFPVVVRHEFHYGCSLQRTWKNAQKSLSYFANDVCTRDSQKTLSLQNLAHCHACLVEMSQLLQSMDVLHRTYSAPAINAIQANAKLKVYFTLRSAFNTISTEREKLKQLMEQDVSASPSAQVLGLKRALSSVSYMSVSQKCLTAYILEPALAQNTDLKERLRRIHAESLLLDPPAAAKSGDSLAEISEDDSYVSDISDNLSLDNLSNDLDNERQTLGPVLESGGEAKSKRRTCLPAPCPSSSSVSLWNILRNNIGKDLSKVAMPVELNEPLNTLQRLCEELEYSELLDKASRTPSALERMVYVAAFAVSAYASSYFRAGSKPFNPVLGETYECIREDKGFQFFSEQVNIHPFCLILPDLPNATCMAGESRISHSICLHVPLAPLGIVTVTFSAFSFRDHFEWNKVTSCIHNILSGQRWIEHYGEIVIKNLNDDSCHCKVNFIKAKYWSTNAHEIEGTVFDKSGKAVHRLFGKWHESIYCGGSSSSACIWRAS